MRAIVCNSMPRDCRQSTLGQHDLFLRPITRDFHRLKTIRAIGRPLFSCFARGLVAEFTNGHALQTEPSAPIA